MQMVIEYQYVEQYQVGDKVVLSGGKVEQYQYGVDLGEEKGVEKCVKQCVGIVEQ